MNEYSFRKPKPNFIQYSFVVILMAAFGYWLSTVGPEHFKKLASELLEQEEGHPASLQYNFASMSSGARVIDSTPGAFSGKHNILNDDPDNYLSYESSSSGLLDISFVVRLTEDIEVNSFELINLESLSCNTKNFKVALTETYPPEQKGEAWRELGGTFEFSNNLQRQTFQVQPQWGRFLRFRILSHYTVENYYFCTISQIKIYGNTLFNRFSTAMANALGPPSSSHNEEIFITTKTTLDEETEEFPREAIEEQWSEEGYFFNFEDENGQTKSQYCLVFPFYKMNNYCPIDSSNKAQTAISNFASSEESLENFIKSVYSSLKVLEHKTDEWSSETDSLLRKIQELEAMVRSLQSNLSVQENLGSEEILMLKAQIENTQWGFVVMTVFLIICSLLAYFRMSKN